MKNVLLFFAILFSTLVLNSQTVQNRINGFIFNNGEPLKNAQIINKTTGKIAFTDTDGHYELEASVKDKLEFSSIGMQTELKEVSKSSFSINVSLKKRIIELDNVTVVKSKSLPRSQNELHEAYDIDKEIIRTAFGFRDSRQINTALPVISNEQFNKGVSNILLAIQSLVPSLRLKYNQFGQPEGVNLRSNQITQGSATAIYDVDGMVYEKPPSFLSVSEIDRVAVLYPGGASSMYGYRGGNGVIVINTKRGNFSPPPKKKSAQLIYQDVITETEARRNWPNFLKDFYKCRSLIEAIGIYDSYEGLHDTNPNFNIDSSMYFMKYWPNEAFTKQLILENLERFVNDSAYLKAMAFLMDTYGKVNESVDLYKRLLIQRSNSVQSYRDLANAYIQSGSKDIGTNLYIRYFNLLKEGFFNSPAQALEQVIYTEVKKVLDIPEEISHPILDVLPIENDESRTRILLEWNDDSAEISFQFVSQKHGTNDWSNTANGSYGFNGCTSKDFLVYGNPGSWQINTNYGGNISQLATYLKVTISNEYGTDKQKDKIKLFRLAIRDVNRRLVQMPNLE